MFEEPVEAVIFDMDGTLLDSEAVYIVALQDAAHTLGFELPLALCHATVGTRPFRGDQAAVGRVVVLQIGLKPILTGETPS